MTLRSVRSMISMVKMPSRKEWGEEEEVELIHLTSSHLSLGLLLEVLFEDNLFSSLTIKLCYSPCGSEVINCMCIFREQAVVAVAGAEGKGGERMLFIH